MRTDYLIYIIIAISTLAITALAEIKLIPIFSRNASQPIYLAGPRWHSKKSGTPTLGGLAFLIATVLTLGASTVYLFVTESRDSAISLALCLSYGALNSFIGIADDLTKLKRKMNAGLTPLQKLILQSLLAAAFLFARATLIGESTKVTFGSGDIDFGFFYYPLTFFMLIGTVNAANLTDGIDGLASCVAFAIGVAVSYLSFDTNQAVFFVSAAIIGSAVSFLLFNLHPARIFMGDTGSLFLGALISAGIVALGNPLLVLFLGGVYLIEALSVIIQVVCFKISGRRVFKMAPIHHHLEQCGIGENTICILAIIVTLILSIPAVMLYK